MEWPVEKNCLRRQPRIPLPGEERRLGRAAIALAAGGVVVAASFGLAWVVAQVLRFAR